MLLPFYAPITIQIVEFGVLRLALFACVEVDSGLVDAAWWFSSCSGTILCNGLSGRTLG